MSIIMPVFFIVSGIAILFVLGDIYRNWSRLTLADKSPLDIKTFDGLNSPYHPSVLFFKDGWNGWRYWMAETPFSTRSKPYWDRNECPSIHVSQDGIKWTVPQGLKNPIIDLNEKQIKDLDYFSDPHLVYRPIDNKIEVWFRLTERSGVNTNVSHVSLHRMTSADGISWTYERIANDLSDNSPDKGLGDTVVSPALLLDDVYRIWYVNVEKPIDSVNRGVSFATSVDGKKWSDHVRVTFNRQINPWHIDVQRFDGRLYMSVYDLHDLTLWSSNDGIHFNFEKVLYEATGKMGSCFRKLYRSCLLKDDVGYKVYFSGWDLIDTHVGLLTGNNLDRLNQCMTGSRSFTDFCLHYFRFQAKRIAFVVRNSLNNVKQSLRK